MNPITQFIETLNSENLWDKTITLKRHAYLNVAGCVDTNLYLVLGGSLRIYVIENLEEHTIRFGYKNNLIAALDAFISEQPSNLYIQALKKTQVKVASKTKVTRLIESSAKYSKMWQRILESFVLQQMQREQDILTASPLERYNRVLKRSPQLFQEIPNKYIAAYLRMTPETLSRIKKT